MSDMFNPLNCVIIAIEIGIGIAIGIAIDRPPKGTDVAQDTGPLTAAAYAKPKPTLECGGRGPQADDATLAFALRGETK